MVFLGSRRGVGTTQIAKHLATAVAAAPMRPNVLLVDGDRETHGLGVATGFERGTVRPTLDEFAGAGSLAPRPREVREGRDAGGRVFMVSAPAGDAHENWKRAFISSRGRPLRSAAIAQGLACIIVDAGPSFAASAQDLVRIADVVLVVGEDDLSLDFVCDAVEQSQATNTGDGHRAEWGCIVNRARHHRAHTTHRKVYLSIPDSHDAALRRQIGRLAEKIFGPGCCRLGGKDQRLTGETTELAFDLEPALRRGMTALLQRAERASRVQIFDILALGPLGGETLRLLGHLASFAKVMLASWRLHSVVHDHGRNRRFNAVVVRMTSADSVSTVRELRATARELRATAREFRDLARVLILVRAAFAARHSADAERREFESAPMTRELREFVETLSRRVGELERRIEELGEMLAKTRGASGSQAHEMPEISDFNRRAETHIFVSYSHKDRKYCEEILAHLRRIPGVSEFSDRSVSLGRPWKAEIDAALSQSRVGVLLISTHFLNSDFIREHESPILLGGAKLVIPVYVRRSTVGTVPYRYPRENGPQSMFLTAFQGPNSPERPLRKLSPDQRDAVYVDLVNQICSRLAAARDRVTVPESLA